MVQSVTSAKKPFDWQTPILFSTGVALLTAAYYVTGDVRLLLLVIGGVVLVTTTLRVFTVTPENVTNRLYDSAPVLLFLFVLIGIPFFVKTVGAFLLDN